MENINLDQDAVNKDFDGNASLTPVRDAESDIIGGARQTDQLDKLRENAGNDRSDGQTSVAPLDVNDGSKFNASIDSSTQPKVAYPKSEEEN